MTEKECGNILKRYFKEAESLLCEYRQSEGAQREMAKNKLLLIFLGDMEDIYVNRACASSRYPQSAKSDLAAVYLEVVVEVLSKYKPDNGKLEHYFNFLWSHRRKNIKLPDVYLEDAIYSDGDTGDKVERGERLPDTTGTGQSPEHATESKMMLESYMIQLSALIASMFEHSAFKKDATVKEKYFKMLFTEQLAAVTKQSEGILESMQHKRQVFQAVQTIFLDFFMEEICRDVEAIRWSPLKTYGDIGIDKDKECEIEFRDIAGKDIGFKCRGKIYYRYFLEVENSSATENSISVTISQQGKGFSELNKMLQEQFR